MHTQYDLIYTWTYIGKLTDVQALSVKCVSFEICVH